MDERVDHVEPATVGETFAAERERQGLSRQEVAQRLHMSTAQIASIEENAFERLPKGPFLRGFVRNYAKVLGLAPESMVSRLVDAAPRDTAPTIAVPSHNIRFGNETLSNSPYVRAGILAVVFLLVVLAGIYWWLFVRTAPPVNPVGPVNAVKQDEPRPQNLAAPVAIDAGKADALVIPSEPRMEVAAEPPKATASPGAPAASPALPAAAQPAPAPGAAAPNKATSGPQGALQFKFRGASWVEVRDADGQPLISRVNAAGTEAQVAGKLPLVVTIGNAAAVSVLYNDRDFSLEPHTKVSVARFTLDKP